MNRKGAIEHHLTDWPDASINIGSEKLIVIMPSPLFYPKNKLNQQFSLKLEHGLTDTSVDASSREFKPCGTYTSACPISN